MRSDETTLVLGIGGAAGVPQLAAESVAFTLTPNAPSKKCCLQPAGVPALAGCSAAGVTSTEGELVQTNAEGVVVAFLRSDPVPGAAAQAQHSLVEQVLHRCSPSNVIALACTEPARMPRGAPLAMLAPDKDDMGLEGTAANIGAIEVLHPPLGAGMPLPPFTAVEALRQHGARVATLISCCGGGDATTPALELAHAALVTLDIQSVQAEMPPAWHSRLNLGYSA